MAFALLFAVPFASAVQINYTCTTSEDCELLGSCINNGCVCRPGWKGPSCGTVDVLPVETNREGSSVVAVDVLPVVTNREGSSVVAGAIWPPHPDDNTTFSWGFTAVYDETSQLYHAAVNVGCCGLGKDGAHWPAEPTKETCGVTVGGTYLAHVTSPYPDHGYTQSGVFVGPTAFNPHLIRAPNGTFILYFRVNDKDNYEACSGGDPIQNSSSLKTYIPASDITHTDPSGEGPGANMYVSSATSMAGPWTTTRVVITGMGDLHISNPSIALLADGNVMLAYRFNPHGGEQNGFALATSYRGPFGSYSNLTKAPGNDEDPYLWEQQDDGSLHILYHNGAHGLHAFSGDKGKTWAKSPTKSHAFALEVEVGTGIFTLSRRERPELLFANDGSPRFLINGVNTPGAALPGGEGSSRGGGFSHAFSFVQPINASIATTPVSTRNVPKNTTGTGRGFGDGKSQEPIDTSLLSSSSWWYSWGLNPIIVDNTSKAMNFTQEFVAMVWGRKKMPDLEDWTPHPSTKHLLGFYEPNLHSQSNFTPAAACELWPAVVAAAKKHDMKVGSPAANHCTPGGAGRQDTNCFQTPTDWFDAFFALDGCGVETVDFIATHKYGCNSTSTMEYVEMLHKRYAKPIWLTEFSCGKARTSKQLAFAQKMLPLFDSRPEIIPRYAWFSARGKGPDGAFSNESLIGPDNELTTLGEYYNTLHPPPTTRRPLQ